MNIFGMLVLRKEHSVHPDFVGIDQHGNDIITLDGCELPPPINPDDIIGFGKHEMGDDAHIYVEVGAQDEYELDDLEEIRDFFA